LAKSGANVCPTNMTTQPSGATDPAEGNENTGKAGTYSWTRFALQVGSDSFTATGSENQATTLLDLIVVPTGC